MKFSAYVLLGAYLLSSLTPAFAAETQDLTDAYKAMAYAEDQGILEPMSDGFMHAEMPLSRRDLVVSIVRSVYKNDIREDCFDRISPELPASFTHLFTDTTVWNASAKEICVGMFVGLVEGRPDGSFSPQEGTNLVDAAKVITKAYGIAPLPSLRPQSRVPWHEPYWFALAKRGAIPETVKSRDSVLTRGELAEILYRLRDERPTQGFRYQSSMVKDLASNTLNADVRDSFSYPSVSVDHSAVALIDTNLSSGLRLQLHTAQRRMVRIQENDRMIKTDVSCVSENSPLYETQHTSCSAFVHPS